MEWVRGEAVGRGSFATVNLAIRRRSDCSHIPQLMAVKSALISQSSSLQNEKEILCQLRDCPQILGCFGNDFSIECGNSFYNVLLEYASRGTLADLLKNSGAPLPESEVRRYTKSILKGLCYTHENGYVHCDIKLHNILLCSASDGGNDVKIADFGLAKKAGQREDGVSSLRGTPLYMSPESVTGIEQEAPSDIWSLGCVVAELVAGKPAWRCRDDSDVGALLLRIGFGEELPEIPGELSEQGRDFLRRCFVRDPSKRWTAKMLLNHPFVADDTVSLPVAEKPFSSPRSAFDFPEWTSPRSSFSNSAHSSPSPSTDSSNCFEGEFHQPNSSSSSPTDRIRQIVTRKQPNWSSSDSWVIAREAESSVSQLEEAVTSQAI
ncbi:hypothetical protein HHK36_002597 [Tetracentron sinense]|uniref:Protein kinase domain-containing protein n=1 Tax=Tetracentron sinense TaxID=13715 RepID=A0A834ZMG7_TETSI|nr:hypothetical protein HHK36_002597 [Tetracentron sinense]